MAMIHDIDVVILMATMLSSKRRPAELVEVVAAADLIRGSIPSIEKIGDAIKRLSTRGLIIAADDGYMLTPSGQAIMAKQPKRAASEELAIAIKNDLTAYRPKEECPPIPLTDEQISAAIRAHKVARKSAGKNFLMPKTKGDRYFKVEGHWRKLPATR